jgi:hypothetical protein
MSVILGAPYPDLYAAVGVRSSPPYAAAHDLATAYVAMQHGGLAPAHRESRTSGALGCRRGWSRRLCSMGIAI